MTAWLTMLQLKLRLKTLLDKKRMMQSRSAPAFRRSARFITLQEGFQQFSSDLNKLEVYAGATESQRLADIVVAIRGCKCDGLFQDSEKSL